jgi:prepilin-type N-terminal cleavage/methylation domain-containing protein
MQISKLQFKIQNLLKYNKGFSLIEMLVAVAVFAVMATISAGALLNASDSQQKILAIRVTQDNLNYALDVIGKEIRTGSSYHCGLDISLVPLDCPSGGSSFTFLNASDQTVTYRLNSQRLEVSKDGGANWQFLTSSDLIIIDQLSFYTVGAPANDGLQPRVTVVLRGIAGLKEKIKSRFNIQTTVSQRILDS